MSETQSYLKGRGVTRFVMMPEIARLVQCRITNEEVSYVELGANKTVELLEISTLLLCSYCFPLSGNPI